jgi:hypothetical protein
MASQLNVGTTRLTHNRLLIMLVCSTLTLATFAHPALAQQNTSPDLPESPGATLAKMQASAAEAQIANSSGVPPTQQLDAPQTSSPQATAQAPQKPVGTAAAEPTGANGIAASQPAGVAIAPGKQRRVRTIVISIAAIAAAGVAIGSVAALTAGTSSRPPGAH